MGGTKPDILGGTERKEPVLLFKPSKVNHEDLISANEKTQVEVNFLYIKFKIKTKLFPKALRQRYKDMAEKSTNQKKLQRLKFFSIYIIPAILFGNF